MRWLIRRVLKKGKGAVSYEEDVHYGDVLTIGRAADQAIFLPDLRAALNHARVTLLSNGQYKVESLIIAGIRVNGDATQPVTQITTFMSPTQFLAPRVVRLNVTYSFNRR